MTDSQALLQEGLAAFRARAYDEALRAWRTLLSFEPNHPQVKELVVRTETLAAEGQIVHQLKEELADLREELATTRDSRNDLLLEMARVHKRYEEREARLWRMQEAREWELREALADAELQSFQLEGSDASNLSNEELLHATEDALQTPPPETTSDTRTEVPQAASPPVSTPNDENEELQQAREQIRVLRGELNQAHERIVELEQHVHQYEHDENHGEYPGIGDDEHSVFSHAVHDALDFSDEERAVAFDHIISEEEDEDEEDAFGFLAPSAFHAVESQTIDTDRHINEDALFGVNPTATQSSNIIRNFDTFGALDDEDDDDGGFTGPLIADDVLNQPTTPHPRDSVDRVNENKTQNLKRNVVHRDDPPTGSFDPSNDDDLDGLPSEDEPVLDTLVGLVIEETSGIIDLGSATKREPERETERQSSPSFEAVNAPADEDEDDGGIDTHRGFAESEGFESGDDAMNVEPLFSFEAEDEPLETLQSPVAVEPLGDFDTASDDPTDSDTDLGDTNLRDTGLSDTGLSDTDLADTENVEAVGAPSAAPDEAESVEAVQSQRTDSAALEGFDTHTGGGERVSSEAEAEAEATLIADDAPTETSSDGAADHAAASSSAVDPDLAALLPARPRDDSADTAEIDLQPIEDTNIADGFGEELADALGSTPEPPRLMTGVQPELPDFDFMEDEPERMSPDELERRPTWVPVRHKAKPDVDDAVARYLLTHIDGVSTFMELRGTVGLPPAAVDSGFRTLLAADIIRVRRG